MNDPVLIGVLCTVAGIAVGVLAMLGFRASEQRRIQEQPLEEVDVPEGATEVLSVLGRAYVVVDAVGGVVRASPSSYALGLVRGHHLAQDYLKDLVERVRDEASIIDRPLELPRGGGEIREIHLRVAPLGEEYILFLAEDRSELARSQAIRHDFVANVSHELKTPVGAIRLLAEAIDDAADDPTAVRRFSSRLSTEALRLGALIQDIIELSRVQSKDAVDEAAPVDINHVVADSIDRVRTEAESKNISLKFRTGEPLRVFGDKDQLTMALRNLVINAVGYSPEGTTVGIGIKTVDDLIEISVADQGLGISEEDQERIFERFYRVDSARSRGTGGTGLGLSIVKHVVANHGGEITVWSQPDQGSTFTVRLPEMLHEELEPHTDSEEEGEDE